MVSQQPSQFCILSHWQDGGLHGGCICTQTDGHVTKDSRVGNKGFWAFTVNCSGIETKRCALCLRTAVLKDFLCELPEPLGTQALLPMLLDTLAVKVPGDAPGNARLMLGVLDCLPQVNQVGSVWG